MALEYRVGDATAPEGPGPHVIAHVCNDAGGWGKGFVVALSSRWPEPEHAYRRWARSGEGFVLGMVQMVRADADIVVANMVAQHDYVSASNAVAIRYDALSCCLEKLGDKLPEGTIVNMPRIGCGLAGGDWTQIEPLVEAHLAVRGFEVRVYDLPKTR